MKYKLSVILFYIFLLCLLVLNGWGLPICRTILPYVILLTPFILLQFGTVDTKQPFKIPVRITTLFILFITVSSISTVNAIHIQKAFEYQLFYIATFLMFLYAYNYKSNLQKYIGIFIFSATGLSVIYAILLTYFISPDAFFLVPYGTYQLVYKYSDNISHHPIGIILSLPAIILLYRYVKNRSFSSLLMFISLLVVIFFSYARATYIALFCAAIPLIFTNLQNKKKSLLFLASLIFTLIICFVLTTSFTKNNAAIDNIQTILHKKAGLQNKTLLSGRDKYFLQVVEAIAKKPLTGYGANNYYYIARQYSKNIFEMPNSSHNLFLDIVSENGIPAFVFYLGIMILLFVKGINFFKINKDPRYLFGLFTGLFIIFQFSFYYKVQFLYILFFIIGGLIYSENNPIHDKYRITLLVSFVLVLVPLLLFTAYSFRSNGQYKEALNMYPVYYDVYPEYIRSEYRNQNHQKVEQLIKQFDFYYDHEPAAQNFIATVYLLDHRYDKALEYFNNALTYYPTSLYALRNMYYLKKTWKGPYEAEQFLMQYYRSDMGFDPAILITDKELWRFCFENIIGCQK